MPTADHQTRPSTGNRLLDLLPPDIMDFIRPNLALAPLPRGLALIAPGENIASIYFPVAGMVSVVRRLKDGSSIEVAVIGKDGMVGVSILLGDDREQTESMVQIAGSAWKLSADIMRELLDAHPAVRRILTPFVQTLIAQMSQSAACNARHASGQRLARWLLTASDAIGSNAVTLGHEFISIMLGIRRAGVTVAMANLRDAGLIHSGRGWVTINDRPGLERAACECYRDTADERARLFPPRL